MGTTWCNTVIHRSDNETPLNIDMHEYEGSGKITIENVEIYVSPKDFTEMVNKAFENRRITK